MAGTLSLPRVRMSGARRLLQRLFRREWVGLLKPTLQQSMAKATLPVDERLLLHGSFGRRVTETPVKSPFQALQGQYPRTDVSGTIVAANQLAKSKRILVPAGRVKLRVLAYAERNRLDVHYSRGKYIEHDIEHA